MNFSVYPYIYIQRERERERERKRGRERERERVIGLLSLEVCIYPLPANKPTRKPLAI